MSDAIKRAQLARELATLNVDPAKSASENEPETIKMARWECERGKVSNRT